jgi:DNA polymerase I/DNA polymerase-2
MKRNVFLLDADYVTDGDGTWIRLWGKGARGTSTVVYVRCEPAFYVLPADEHAAEKEIRRLLEENRLHLSGMETAEKSLQGRTRRFLRLRCRKPQDTHKMRDVIKTLEKERGGSGSVEEEYEYGINAYRKFLMDRRIDGSCWIQAEGSPAESGCRVREAMRAEEVRVLEDDSVPDLRTAALDVKTLRKSGEDEIAAVTLWTPDFSTVLAVPEAGLSGEARAMQDEQSLLREAARAIRDYDPDLVLTYGGDGFDFILFMERCRAFRLKTGLARDGKEPKFARRARTSAARINGLPHLDLAAFVHNILAPGLQTEIPTLERVAAEMLGDSGLVQRYQRLLQAWKRGEDPAGMSAFCLLEGELAHRLGREVLPQLLEICRIVGQCVFDVSRMTFGQLVEWHLSRKAAETGRIIPNQPKFQEIRQRRQATYSGGLVREPVLGEHEDIAVLDFRSLYPSIMVSYNISPETLNCSCCGSESHQAPGTGHRFCARRRGFLPGVVGDLLGKRREIKSRLAGLRPGTLEHVLLDNRQNAMKVIANASYGYMGYPASKWYCRECAESCAAYGRYWIREAAERAEDHGLEVIYGDTDSLFVIRSGSDTQTAAATFLESINASFPGILELDRKGTYPRGLFVPREGAGAAKKRYALVDSGGGLVLRGLEAVRRDWCELAKDVQRQVLLHLLRDNAPDKAAGCVREAVRRLRAKRVDLREVTLFEELSRPLERYRQTAPHVAAARKLKQQGHEMPEGTLVMYVVAEGGGGVSERAEPIEYARVEDIDPEYYIEHQVIPAAMRILRTRGVSAGELR